MKQFDIVKAQRSVKEGKSFIEALKAKMKENKKRIERMKKAV